MRLQFDLQRFSVYVPVTGILLGMAFFVGAVHADIRQAGTTPYDSESARRTIYLSLPSIIGVPTGTTLLMPTADADIATLNTLYRRGRAREQHGVYSTAVSAYMDTLSYGRHVIEQSPSLSRGKIFTMLPYLVGASYRLGVTTQKSLNRDMSKLSTQLEMFKEANDQISYLLSFIADIKSERSLPISRTSYSILYYAKGYNKIALAKTLINGNIWKNYTVYMPADVVSLVKSAIGDFEMMLEFSNLSREVLAKLHGAQLSNGSVQVSEEQVANYLAGYTLYARDVDYECRSLQLTYYMGNLDDIAVTLRKRVVYSVYPILDYFYSPDIQAKLYSFNTVSSVEDARTVPVELYNIVSRMFEITQQF